MIVSLFIVKAWSAEMEFTREELCIVDVVVVLNRVKEIQSRGVRNWVEFAESLLGLLGWLVSWVWVRVMVLR